MKPSQLPLPSRSDIEKRKPKGKRPIELTSSDTHTVTKREKRNAFKDAKLPDAQVNLANRHLVLGYSFLERALDHCRLAQQHVKDGKKLLKLATCEEGIKEMVREWPVKVV